MRSELLILHINADQACFLLSRFRCRRPHRIEQERLRRQARVEERRLMQMQGESWTKKVKREIFAPSVEELSSRSLPSANIFLSWNQVHSYSSVNRRDVVDIALHFNVIFLAVTNRASKWAKAMALGNLFLGKCPLDQLSGIITHIAHWIWNRYIHGVVLLWSWFFDFVQKSEPVQPVHMGNTKFISWNTDKIGFYPISPGSGAKYLEWQWQPVSVQLSEWRQLSRLFAYPSKQIVQFDSQ